MKLNKHFSHDQNTKTKMRIYFISSFNILFKAIYSRERFANTDFTNALFSNGKMFHLSSTSLNAVCGHTTGIFLSSLHIFIFSVFSSFYFIFSSNCPESSTNKPYEVPLNRRQIRFIAKMRLHVSSVPKTVPRCMQTPQERLSTCTENKHLQISILLYSKMPGSHDSSTGKTPEDSRALTWSQVLEQWLH